MQKATRTRLAHALGIKLSYLAKIVSQIRDISEDAYLSSFRLHTASKQARPNGPPRVYYELKGENLATFPETAFLLLELLEYPKEMSRRVNTGDFVNSMAAKTNLEGPKILARIQWALEHDYLAADDEMHVACQERTALELPYLKLLASHFAVSQ